MGGPKPGGWMIGSARYADGAFEWYRAIDPRHVPTIVLRRGGLVMREHHPPVVEDALALALTPTRLLLLKLGIEAGPRCARSLSTLGLLLG